MMVYIVWLICYNRLKNNMFVNFYAIFYQIKCVFFNEYKVTWWSNVKMNQNQVNIECESYLDFGICRCVR